MVHRLLVVSALLCTSCVSPEVGVSEQPIVGGLPSDRDEAVVALLEWAEGCGVPPSVGCSGVLVSPRVVLTAAHCIDPLLRAHQASVFVGPEVSREGARIAVADHLIDPLFDRARGDHDLGLLLLAEPAPVAPITLVDHDASALSIGRELRVVGFGVTEAGTETQGIRRAGVMSLTSVDAFNLTSAASPSMSCDGDSGGPVYAQVDGSEVLVGITSAGDRECLESARNARVDERLDAFIRPGIAELEAIAELVPSDPTRLAGLCGERCTTTEQCPSGMRCDIALDGLSYCSLGLIGPGAIEEECASDVECRGRACVRLASPDGCRCFDPCFEAPMLPDAGMPAVDAGPGDDAPAGCSVSSSPGDQTLGWLFALVCLVWRGRRTA